MRPSRLRMIGVEVGQYRPILSLVSEPGVASCAACFPADATCRIRNACKTGELGRRQRWWQLNLPAPGGSVLKFLNTA
jgi:hypothetical protein